MTAVVGREPELEAIERLLEDGRSRLAGLVLEGDAGIGKTTLWREAIRRADESGYRILRCHPAAAEARLAFASLGDLLEPIGEDVLSRLPDPQRHALDVALLRARPRRPIPDARAVATGVLSVLGSYADTPLLVAIDDAQWLDRPSAGALSFALRRLDAATPIALLVSVRLETARALTPLALDLPAARAERIRLAPLSLSSLYHVIKEELDLVFPRPTLQRIEQACGGNPLFALEVARALAEHGGRPGPGEPLPVPDELAELMRSRISRLPASSRESLLAAALLSTPTVRQVEQALGKKGEPALERALHAGVIEVRDERIRFRHPLLAEAVSSSAVPARRRAMHHRLADVAESEEQRARHLALAAERPDEVVADSLERAARLAGERAAPEEAAELLELSCRLTPEDERAGLTRRRLALAESFQRAGDASEAARLLDDLLQDQASGPLRAQALELRAQIHWVAGTAHDAEACCEEALEHVGEDDRLRARALVTFARVTVDVDALQERSRVALDFLETLDDADPGLVSEALVGLVESEFYLGRGLPEDLVRRALELEEIAPPRNVGDRMSSALGAYLKYDGDFDGARHWLEASRRAALDEGDEGSLPYVLGHLPQLELWTGNWARAEELALEHLELSERTGQSLERLTAIYNLTLVQAHMGRVVEARSLLEEALAEAEGGEPWNVYQLLSVLGFLELSVGRYAEAVTSLGRALEIYEESGGADTPMTYENYPEALVLTGDLETAERITEVYERRALKANRAMTLAPALRSRALLSSARQKLDEAEASLDQALSYHEQVAMPFSRARTLLVVGQVRRRRGERRAAKDALEQALGILEELGAPLWAERVRAELARIPIRRSVATDALTPTEARVAELVAQGGTNKDVAKALFVSEKTVEANLTRIYRKLGVHSRAALATRMVETREGDAPET